MKGSTFAVVVTCFNRSETIGRALESLDKQTYKEFQIIVVDDASVDDSVLIVRNFARLHQRLNLEIYQHTVNLGQNAAINTGLTHSNSDLVAFLDSDDQWEPNFIKLMIQPFVNDEVDFAYCSVMGGPTWTLQGEKIYKKVLQQGYLSALGTLVVRRPVLQSILPLPERLFVNDMCQDDYICFELSKYFNCVAVPAHLYRIIGANNSLSITSNKKHAAVGWYQFYKHYEADIAALNNSEVFNRYFLKCLMPSFESLSFKLSHKILLDSFKYIGYTSTLNLIFRSIIQLIRDIWRKSVAKIFSYNPYI
jgi:glycosyltransferase involved in cell wall biosynthesis